MSVFCFKCGKNLSDFSGIKKCPFCKQNLAIFGQKNVPVEQDTDDIESRIVRKVIVKKQLSESQKNHLKKLHENNKIKLAIKKAETINSSKKVNSKKKPIKEQVIEEYDDEDEEEVQTQEQETTNPYSFLF